MLDRKGRGGKSVSVIKQVMSLPAGKEALLKLLKTKLGTGGTIKDGDIELNAKRKTVTLTIANTGDRPIQVGSLYHFFETNPALRFDL